MRENNDANADIQQLTNNNNADGGNRRNDCHARQHRSPQSQPHEHCDAQHVSVAIVIDACDERVDRPSTNNKAVAVLVNTLNADMSNINQQHANANVVNMLVTLYYLWWLEPLLSSYSQPNGYNTQDGRPLATRTWVDEGGIESVA
jgi:hypothetical protein